MEERLQQKRIKIIYDVWQDNKANITMKELSEIFKISLDSTYRILKVGSKKFSKSKNHAKT